MGTEQDRDQVGELREEAERLVSAGMAAASYALRGVGRVTPLGDVADRVLGAVRSPSPQLAWKLASGLTDVASGVASVLRTVERFAAPPREPARRPRDAGATWRAATRQAADARPGRRPAAGDDPWRAATADPPAAPDRPAENLLPPEARD